MTVLKEYNQATSTWDAILVGEQGPPGAGVGISVKDYGAIGDGVTDDTAAFTAALAAADAVAGPGTTDVGAEVHLTPGECYSVSPLTVPVHVRLVGHQAGLAARTAGILVTLGECAEIVDTHLFGLGAVAGVSGILCNGQRNRVNNCWFDQFSGPAIKIALNGSVSWITECFAQNCLLDTASLTEPTGVLDIGDATDLWVRDCEFTASRSSSISSGGYAYAIANRGTNNTFHDVVGEISDHGWYLNGYYTRLVMCRADLNRGHGFVIAGGSGSMTGCFSLNNGQQTDNTYDGFNLNACRYVISDCTSESMVANRHRYGFNDQVMSGTVKNQWSATNKSYGHGTAPLFANTFAGSYVATVGGGDNATAGATVLDVQLFGWPSDTWQLASTSPVNMTNFTNGVVGQQLVIIGDGFTTFVHSNGVLNLLGGANELASAGVVYRFLLRDSYTGKAGWQEF